MRSRTITSATSAIGLLFASVACSTAQSPVTGDLDEQLLREYSGVYQWSPDSFVYLQSWNELTGKNQLVAFDESGEVRTLYPTDQDRFFTGPGAAVATATESEVEFQRNGSGEIVSLTWRRGDASARIANRVEIERREGVRFANGSVHLSGTLIAPNTPGKHSAIILVHGSGAANREWMLPYAHFLVRHGFAILTYDKRGVGESTGDWNTASFDDLASDVVAAFNQLRQRSDIETGQIGLLGVSQAGWVMPLAAARAEGLAFLISISGPGVPPAETTIDHAQREMAAAGMPADNAGRILELMRLQYRFARTGQGWDEYATARQNLVARMGAAPPSFPGTEDHPLWESMRRTYFHDPAPTLRQLRLPILALFGELDNNVLADKNRAAWAAALEAGGNRDHALHILPGANHLMLEARVGNNAEMASLQRFVPAYFTTVREWLASHVPPATQPVAVDERH